MNNSLRTSAAAAALAATLSLTACTGSHAAPSGHPTSSPSQDRPLQTKHQAEVTAALKNYGDQLATAVGAPLQNWDSVPAPCQNADGVTATDGRFDMTGNANILVPADQHIAVLTRIRELWKQQGYKITEFRTFPPDNKAGTVSAINPDDDITLSLESDAPRTSFAVLIATPCYRAAPGEHPAG
jgi:hypothetical protein